VVTRLGRYGIHSRFRPQKYCKGFGEKLGLRLQGWRRASVWQPPKGESGVTGGGGGRDLKISDLEDGMLGCKRGARIEIYFRERVLGGENGSKQEKHIGGTGGPIINTIRRVQNTNIRAPSNSRSN